MWPKNCSPPNPPGWLTATSGSLSSSGRNTNINNINKTKLKLANWNVRTLLDGGDRPERRTAIVAQQLAAYDIDIAALSETRLSGEGSLTEVGQGYTYFWRGVPEGQPRVHGVGLAIRNKIVNSLTELPVGHSERLMSVRVPLARSKYMTIISAYAPTLQAEEEVKDQFYCALTQLLQRVHREDKLWILGDFNARVGTDADVWPGVLGHHGIGNMNSNGLRLLTFCSEFDLTITNTHFQRKNIHKNTWKHPGSGHGHMIDHVITRKDDMSECLSSRSMRGAQCNTDHMMQRVIIVATVRPPVRKTGMRAKRLNTALLKNEQKVLELKHSISGILAQPESTRMNQQDVTEEWASLSKRLYDTSVEQLGFQKKRHQDWFDENEEEIANTIAEKNKAHNKYLCRPTRANKQKWKEMQQRVQRVTRELKDKWWENNAREIQRCADEGRIQAFYESIKKVSGPVSSSICPIKDTDGTLLKDNDKILKRWAEYYSSLLNSSNPTDQSILEELPQLPTVYEMDVPPTLEEVKRAIDSLKNGKAPGPDGIPAEIYKCGDEDLCHALLSIFLRCWQTGEVPKQWLHAVVSTLYKKKGEKSMCSNYRGLSLLDVAGKIFAKIMATRFNHNIAEKILPDSQCGFRADRSTSDMIFVCRQLLEKGREQCQPLSFAFIDLKKAFDTVNRELLFSVLERFGCPPISLILLKALHCGNTAAVRVGGQVSNQFQVTMGVKQGCVLAPVLFNVFLLAVTLLTSRHSETLERSPGIRLRYRCDGGAFNLQRLKSTRNAKSLTVRDMQYADDAAIVAGCAVELQGELSETDAQFSRMGLMMNTDKTEVMHKQHNADNAQPISIRNNVLNEAQDFTYLGSIISNNCTLDREINNRISRASAAFGQLSVRVYLNRNLKLSTKIKVYQAIVISILLYGSETWTLYSKQLKLLNTFHLRCLRRILRITWRDRVPNNVVLSRCGCNSIHSIVAERMLRWAGHMQRMPDERLPKAVFYSEMAEGTRPVGRPKKRYKDHLKETLKKCNIDPTNFEQLANDRSAWRTAVLHGTRRYEELLREKSDEQRRARHMSQARRHQTSDHECPQCGRHLISRAGLASHIRAHQRQRGE